MNEMGKWGNFFLHYSYKLFCIKHQYMSCPVAFCVYTTCGLPILYSLQTHCYCCYKILSNLHDTNTVRITYLSILFLPSLSHIFTFSHSGLTSPRAISYFILHVDYPIMNKATVVTEYYFILLDTNMVPITYY